MSELYDTIIIGSGPAGGTAAFFLSQAGQHVLVLEKESLPRYKTCGGGIPLHLLDQFPFSFEHVIEARISSVSYVLNKRTVTVPLPDRSIGMVIRDQFDAFLLQQTHADIRQSSAVRNVEEQADRVMVETRGGETFYGRYLVAADGASSVAARCLGLRREKLWRQLSRSKRLSRPMFSGGSPRRRCSFSAKSTRVICGCFRKQAISR